MISMTSLMLPRFTALGKVTNCLACITISRSASSGSGETVMNVFDRNAKRFQRDRTTILPDYKVYEYIKEEVSLVISRSRYE